MSSLHRCEYIWTDGASPVRGLRSKVRVMASVNETLTLEDLPVWSFDGSSTNQATGQDSDCLLKPVCCVRDPLRFDSNYLVLCEVLNPDGTPHATNSRAVLRDILAKTDSALKPWFGFEQEYTLFQNGKPLGWPEDGSPRPQGPYYCGVGTSQAYGRDLAEAHAQACLDAGLLYYGLNGEVMPGQWEFQIGFRGDPQEDMGPLNTSDHVWLGRWLLERLSEMYEIDVSLACKPMKGDWNGAGMHTNFSVQETRNPQGLKVLEQYIQRLEGTHKDHIAVYGEGLEDRLTGLHETCSIHEFKAGAADRGCSIRLPRSVVLEGCGYLEDRRPGANADPYLVAARILATTQEVSAASLEAFGRKALQRVA